MKYDFSYIHHINDVLPAIEGSPEFVVVEKDGYTVINYLVSTEDTFPSVKTENDAIRRECRGLVFGDGGNIIARRFHKFFNVNEREETQIHNIDLSEPHIVLEKLDGSMITPIVIGKSIRWGTKMGITDVALPVEEYVADKPNYHEIAWDCIDRGFTPIFEWVSRKQKIVLDYEEDDLILTAIRDNVYGHYFTYEAMCTIARRYNVPVVKAFRSNVDDLSQFVNELSRVEDMEGVVLRFDDGHMVKIKTEWYVRIHKAKESILREHDVCFGILENTLDDVKAFLPNDDLKKIEDYEVDLMREINYVVDNIESLFEEIHRQSFTRKDFALCDFASTMSPLMRAIIFKCWDNSEKVYEVVFDVVKKHCSKAKTFEDMKRQLNITLDY